MGNLSGQPVGKDLTAVTVAALVSMLIGRIFTCLSRRKMSLLVTMTALIRTLIDFFFGVPA